jgi:hypothetical protein
MTPHHHIRNEYFRRMEGEIMALTNAEKVDLVNWLMKQDASQGIIMASEPWFVKKNTTSLNKG